MMKNRNNRFDKGAVSSFSCAESKKVPVSTGDGFYRGGWFWWLVQVTPAKFMWELFE